MRPYWFAAMPLVDDSGPDRVFSPRPLLEEPVVVKLVIEAALAELRDGGFGRRAAGEIVELALPRVDVLGGPLLRSLGAIRIIGAAHEDVAAQRVRVVPSRSRELPQEGIELRSIVEEVRPGHLCCRPRPVCSGPGKLVLVQLQVRCLVCKISQGIVEPGNQILVVGLVLKVVQRRRQSVSAKPPSARVHLVCPDAQWFWVTSFAKDGCHGIALGQSPAGLPFSTLNPLFIGEK